MFGTDLYYKGSVYAGTPGIGGQAYIYDTGSTYTAIPGATCTNCWNGVYKPTNSSSAVHSTDTTKSIIMFSVDYGTDVQATGQFVSDKVCLSKTEEQSCASEMDLFWMTSESGLPPITSGVLGLGTPVVNGYKSNFCMMQNGPDATECSFTLRLGSSE